MHTQILRSGLAGIAMMGTLMTAGIALAADYSLTVLHTNDVNSHLLPSTASGAGGDFGGSARIGGMVRSLRAERQNVLLLDGGDQFQGSLFYYFFKGEAEAQVMNTIGYDAMVAGNHEFDNGPAVLSRFIGRVSFPVLGANIDCSKEAELNGKILPCTMKELNGRKIGILGFTTPETASISSPGTTVSFRTPDADIVSAVAALRAEGADIIIALSHCGYDEEKRIAGIVSGIDIIVGGHTHTYLGSGGANPFGTIPEDAYPTVCNSPDGEPVLIVHAQDWNRYLGDLQVVFNESGVATSWKGSPILMDAAVPADSTITAYLEDKQAEWANLTGEVVGNTTTDLDDSKIRDEECPIGNLITDSFLWEAGSGYQIAFVNSGACRAAIGAGDITIGEVMNVLPYDNYLSTFKIYGADVKAVLENSLTRRVDGDNPLGSGGRGSGTGRFLQVAGLRYTWDPALPKFSRVTGIEVKNSTGGWEALKDSTLYGAVSTDYLRGGGDEYTILAGKAIEPHDYGRKLLDILTDYLRVKSPVTPMVEGRITMTTPVEVAGTPEPFSLSVPYPNPFNSLTRIQYRLGGKSRVMLVIYDVLGRKVRVISEGVRDAGLHSAVWNGCDESDISVASGLYFIRLSADGHSAQNKVMLLR